MQELLVLDKSPPLSPNASDPVLKSSSPRSSPCFVRFVRALISFSFLRMCIGSGMGEWTIDTARLTVADESLRRRNGFRIRQRAISDLVVSVMNSCILSCGRASLGCMIVRRFGLRNGLSLCPPGFRCESLDRAEIDLCLKLVAGNQTRQL